MKEEHFTTFFLEYWGKYLELKESEQNLVNSQHELTIDKGVFETQKERAESKIDYLRDSLMRQKNTLELKEENLRGQEGLLEHNYKVKEASGH